MTWPETQITYGTYQHFAREIGGAMGYGYDPAAWTSSQEQTVDSLIQRGLSIFYNPPAIPGPENHKPKPPHRWSFLFPDASLALVAGTATYDLPDDFSGRIECFTFGSGTDVSRIPIVADHLLRQARLSTAATGDPTVASVGPKTHDGNSRQQFEVSFFPTPDAARTLSYNYEVAPGDLTPTARFPYGGRAHAETILAACMAAMEERTTNARGPRWQAYLERLVASIAQDAALSEATSDALWPTDNLATTLSVDFFELQRQVGRFMGFGPNSLTWTREQTQIVEQIIDEGVRQYYYPPPIDAARQSHEWSFLRPTSEMTTVTDQQVYALPSDFERFCGVLTFADESNPYPSVQVTTEQRIRQLQAASSSSTAAPQWAAVRPTASTGVLEQRQEVLFWPVPDAAYLLAFQYHAIQRKLSSTSPFPLGGQIHGQGLLASCLAAAEGARDGKAAYFNAKFMQRLAAGISADVRRGPEVLGYNGDGNLGRAWSRDGVRARSNRQMTYEGDTWQSGE